MSNSFLFSFYCATCITTSKPLISPPAIKRMQEHIIYGKKQSQNKKSKTVWANKGKMMQILQKTSRLNTEALEVKTEWKHEPNPSIWRKVVAIKGEHFKNTKQWYFFLWLMWIVWAANCLKKCIHCLMLSTYYFIMIIYLVFIVNSLSSHLSIFVSLLFSLVFNRLWSTLVNSVVFKCAIQMKFELNCWSLIYADFQILL